MNRALPALSLVNMAVSIALALVWVSNGSLWGILPMLQAVAFDYLVTRHA